MEPTLSASELVARALRKVARSSQPAAQRHQPSAPDGYTLRVVGRRQYLVADLPLWRYQPVQEALNRGQKLELQLVENTSIQLPGPWTAGTGGEGGLWCGRD